MESKLPLACSRLFKILFLTCLCITPIQGFAEPTSAILTPGPNQSVTVPINIMGTASASDNIQEVLVGIRDEATKLWWNEDSWGAWVLNQAQVTFTNGLNEAQWSYYFNPASTESSGIYRIYTRTRDINQTLSESTQLSFNDSTISTDILSSSITSPVINEMVIFPASISGTASASQGIQEVLVGIRDEVSNLWWNNGTWGEWVLNPAQIEYITATTEALWNYDFNPAGTDSSGQFRIYTRTRDSNNQLSESTQTSFREDDGIIPVLNATVTVPANDQILTEPAELSGTATSSAGVNTVLVGIKDVITGLWWHEGAWGDWMLNPAEVTTPGETEANWQYGFNPANTNGSGQYRLHVRSKDLAGELSNSVQVPFLTEEPVIGDIFTRISVSSDGIQGNNNSFNQYDSRQIMSDDGRYVVFISTATNLVENDFNDSSSNYNRGDALISGGDAFIHNIVTGETRRIDVTTDGNEPNGIIYSASISGNGQFVVFYSYASNFVDGETSIFTGEVFVFDRIANTVEQVNVNSAGEPANSGGGSRKASISSDGRFVVFDDPSTNLVENNTIVGNHIYLHDRELNETIRVSDGVQDIFPNDFCFSPEISANGQVIVFSCVNFSGPAAISNILLYDRSTGETELVNIDPAGLPHDAYNPDISGDGRFVTFTSSEHFLSEDSNNIFALAPWVYVRDRTTNTTRAVDIPLVNFTPASISYNLSTPSISTNGRYIAYYSASSFLVPDDANGVADYFVHDQITGDTVRLTAENGDSLLNSYNLFGGQISPDGSQLIFETNTALISDDTNDKSDIYIVPTGF